MESRNENNKFMILKIIFQILINIILKDSKYFVLLRIEIQ